MYRSPASSMCTLLLATWLAARIAWLDEGRSACTARLTLGPGVPTVVKDGREMLATVWKCA